MKIKPTTAFRAYRAASRARANEGKSFMVKALNKGLGQQDGADRFELAARRLRQRRGRRAPAHAA